MKLEFSRQIVEKVSNTKYHEIPSSSGPVLPCGRTDKHTDMTKLILPFCNFVNVPKNVAPTAQKTRPINCNV